MSGEDLRRRVERLEALDSIRQLASRYALAIDLRDLDALVELFVPEVQVGRDRSGRAALRAWFDAILRERIRETAHLVMNHVIDFDSDEVARGVVYCRAEHDMGEHFVVQQMQYWDTYAREKGAWYFVRRRPLAWYANDVLERPGTPQKMRWPGREVAEAELPGWYPSWEDYWSGPAPQERDSYQEPGPRERWLSRVWPRRPSEK